MNTEGLTIEYKREYIDDIKKTVIAFANTDGENYEEIRSLNQELTFDTLQTEFKDADVRLEEVQMKTLQIIGEDGLYSNLGLLVSEQCVHTVKLAVFEGTTKEIFKDRYEFSGSLFKQLRETYALIDRYNRTSAEFDGLRRIDMREYPPTAIREALLNSIVHRDYSFSGSTLISIFDDRIEIVTIGGLVKGISQDDILLGVSILRNKNLADMFYHLKLIEAYGTGIPKIIESYQQYSASPKMEITDNAFKITLPNTLISKYDLKQEISLSNTEQCVLDMFITQDTIKRKDIEDTLSLSQPMAVKLLRSLLDKSIIQRLGSGKNVYYKLK